MFLTSLSYAFISSYYLSLYRLTVGAPTIKQRSKAVKKETYHCTDLYANISSTPNMAQNIQFIQRSQSLYNQNKPLLHIFFTTREHFSI